MVILCITTYDVYCRLATAKITKILPSSKNVNQEGINRRSGIKEKKGISFSDRFNFKQESFGGKDSDSDIFYAQKNSNSLQKQSSKLKRTKIAGIYDLILKQEDLHALKLADRYIPKLKHRKNPMPIQEESIGQKETHFSKSYQSKALTSNQDVMGINVTQLESIYIKNSLGTKHAAERLETCKNCFYQDFKYFIENTEICNPGNISIDLIILITSSHKNTEARDAIRETWLTHSKNNTGNVRYVFVFGLLKLKDFNDKIRTESLIYKDILQANFYESYLNLTYKTLSGFKWVSENCADVKFVMKTDDDVWINIPNILKVLAKYQTVLQTLVGGACTYGAEVNRNRTSKWYVPRSIYPLDRYPGYCSGTGYVTSMAVVSKIYEVSRDIPYFHLEDVYIGLCLKKLRMETYDIKGFFSHIRTKDACVFKTDLVATAHKVKPMTLRQIWNTNCTKTLTKWSRIKT